uniref:Uncharacterized protein n=1 Tax=Setaria digitata TaxID=48799 RepID=A0A915PMS0_9BILA
MEGCRKALYSYSWQQSPINSRRVNPPEEEQKIFDGWFEEKATEYFPLIRDQGLDNEAVRANASWTLSSPPCTPEIHKALGSVSPPILERLQKPKQDQRTVEEEARKEAERLTNITRYKRSLKETRKAIDKIKREKRRKQICSQTHSVCRSLNELSFREKCCQEQLTAGIKNNVSGSRELKYKLNLSPANKVGCQNIGNLTEQTASSDPVQQTSGYHGDDESDNELLRLALESSPIPKTNSAQRVSSVDELSDDALLAIMTSSPLSSPKFKKNDRADSYRILLNRS